MKKPLLLVILSAPTFFSAMSQNLSAVSVNLFTYLPGNNNERTLEDGIAVFFNGQSDTVDLFDIRKLSNPAENIAILRDNILLAGEQRTSFDTIPVTLWNLQARDYELEIFTRNINIAFLEDVNTHSRITIAAADTIRYRFSSQSAETPLDSSIKFWLIFDTVPPVMPPVHPSCGNNHHNPHDQHYDHRIRLYPNPVYGSYINLEMKNLAAGKCKVTILGTNYESSYSFIHEDSCSEEISISNLPSGKYYFIIEDEEGWKETKQVEVN